MQLSHHHHDRPRRLASTQRARRDGGYILVKFAILIVPLLLMTGFSVDVGFWYNRASDIQKAADAAALAGVVWLPNEAKAEQYAREAAARNGYVDGVDGIDIDVEPVPGNSRRLRVDITDTTVGSFFFLHLGGQEIEISRRATAEYVLPVPLGSPRNFFGTGTLNTGYTENLWLSINPWCTDKVDGDRYQSGFEGNRPYGTSSTRCTTASQQPSSSYRNREYRTTGYEVYIDVPQDRTGSIDVLLFDPRYRVESGGPDMSLYTGNQDYTFTLYRADDTPLSDADNVPIATCTRTYTRDTAFQLSYLGSSRWNRLCTIGTGAQWPTGRYILRMTNSPGTRYGAGANQFSVVARYASYSGNGLCDGRTVSSCPRVYGKDAISVYAASSASTASFFLAEIDPIHTGKTLQLELFDPGEGGDTIEVMMPSGTNGNTWTPARFSWSADGVGSGTNVNILNVQSGGSDRFNGRLLELTIDLEGYSPPANNHWWQIRYRFGDRTVTDRTTWTARVIGDPVHLVEEEAP